MCYWCRFNFWPPSALLSMKQLRLAVGGTFKEKRLIVLKVNCKKVIVFDCFVESMFMARKTLDLSRR